MKIYKVWQNHISGWDTYSDCVIIAEGINRAKRISVEQLPNGEDCVYNAWTWDIHKVHAQEIGIANEKQEEGIVCASFHAG
jgi:hypothetical protein